MLTRYICNSSVFLKALELNQGSVGSSLLVPAPSVLTCHVVYPACLWHDSDLIDLREVPGSVGRRAG